MLRARRFALVVGLAVAGCFADPIAIVEDSDTEGTSAAPPMMSTGPSDGSMSAGPDDTGAMTQSASSSDAPDDTSGDTGCDVDPSACAECRVPEDCDHLPSPDDCRSRACEDGTCVEVFARAGTVVNATLQTEGDCLVVVCDGAGGFESVADDDDIPIDGLECTDDVCTAGRPDNPPLPPGTECAAGTCNGSGACAGCESAGDCGPTTFCQQPTCVDELCGVMNTAAGVSLPAGDQTAGDCQNLQCNGSGGTQSVQNNADVPADDGNACIDEICQGGVPQFPNEPAGTPCGAGGEDVCDGAGVCVGCSMTSDCGPPPTCHTVACVSSACVFEPAASGTPCNDGLFCSGNADMCNGSGQCVGSGSGPCPGVDGDGNCSESCNETTDTCNAADPNGSPCNDNIYCNGSDVCSSGMCAVHTGSPCPLSVPSSCQDGCNEVLDNCNGNNPMGTACDDGLVCTSFDACNGAGLCVGSGISVCIGTEQCFESCGGCAEQDCA